MDVGFGEQRTANEKKKCVLCLFTYMEEDAGVYAAKASVRIAGF